MNNQTILLTARQLNGFRQAQVLRLELTYLQSSLLLQDLLPHHLLLYELKSKDHLPHSCPQSEQAAAAHAHTLSFLSLMPDIHDLQFLR